MYIWQCAIVYCLLVTANAYEDVKPFKIVICDKGCVRRRREVEADIGETVRTLIEHYKQSDPIGLPGAPIPDPVDIPDMKKSIAVTTMTFKKIKVHGLSKFRFQYIKADLAKLEMGVGVKIDTLLVNGQYTLGGWFSRSSGPFTVTLTGVIIDGVAGLLVDKNGKLSAEDIHLDIRFQNIKLNFENLGGMAFVFQGMINSVGTFLFDGIKPFILNEVNSRLLTVINENIEKVPQQFPNSIPPLDMAIASFRSEVRNKGFDPFYLNNMTQEFAGFTASVTNIWLTGLSSFYRTGDVTLAIVDNVANATVQVGTHRIYGQCNWEVSIGFLSKTGGAKFWADYAQAKVSVLQPLNVNRRPRIDKLGLKLGNIQTRVDGSGTLDFIAEFVLNVLPNLLRYQLVSLAEEPLRQRVQDKLNNVNVEDLIIKQLEALEKEKNEGETGTEVDNKKTGEEDYDYDEKL